MIFHAKVPTKNFNSIPTDSDEILNVSFMPLSMIVILRCFVMNRKLQWLTHIFFTNSFGF